MSSKKKTKRKTQKNNNVKKTSINKTIKEEKVVGSTEELLNSSVLDNGLEKEESVDINEKVSTEISEVATEDNWVVEDSLVAVAEPEEKVDVNDTTEQIEEKKEVVENVAKESKKSDLADTNHNHKEKHKSNTEISKARSKNEIKAPRILPKEEEKPLKKSKNDKEVSNVVRYEAGVNEGLTCEQVNQRNIDGLNNTTKSKNVKTYRSIILGNIFTFFNMLAFVVAAALIFVGSWKDCFFLIIVLANMFIGIIQEVKAKKTVEKISLVSSPTAEVVRDGMIGKIPVSEIVLDDIIQLQTGKQICADCIVLDGAIEVNESLLTGESVAIKKGVGDKLYSGSFVVGGKCFARVDKVGGDTYTAKLAAQAKQYQKPKSELMGTLNIIISIIGVLIVPLAFAMFRNNYQHCDYDIVSTIEKTAGSIVGMIPSGMFLLTSMALAVGVIKLAKKRTLVQDLYSIEMLARADVVCLDKTGTITDGSMKVSQVIQIKPDFKYTLDQLVGSMLTALEDNNQTSRALITHFGYSKDLIATDVLPFNSTRKMSGVTFTTGETFIFGAPEYVLKTKNAQVDNLVKNYASKGFRVLLFAECDGTFKDDKIPVKREPIAIIVIEDHIREDAGETIAWFKENGVDIKIISGDNPVTVSEVSRRVGVDNADRYISLEGLTQQQVIDAADKYTVFGRVSPEQKCILVKALRTKGHKVAMTGDGVNDILALKEADCSIAMASGSEATRLVSNLVLLDSNFSSLPSVVAEGRRVINNIQKSSSLFLMKTLFTMLLSVFCLLVRTDYPFSTKQVLLLEILVIGIPSFCLALQPNNEKIKGKFITNLLSKSLPGAILLFLNVLVCYLFDSTFGTSGQFQTMASLMITFVGLLLLFRLCKPFDIFRGIMFASMITLCVLVLSWDKSGAYFEYVPLEMQNILFIVCVTEASYPVYDWIVLGLDKIFGLGKNAVNKNNKQN